MSDNSEFRPVTFQKERDKALHDLATKSVRMGLMVGQDLHGQFNVVSVEGNRVEVEAMAPLSRSMTSGEPVQAVFGLDDGLYLVRSNLGAVFGAKTSFEIGADFHRMQRRNNFRVGLPSDSRVKFELRTYNHSTRGKWQLAPLDLSAGGIRIQWPSGEGAKDLPQPKESAHVSGIISLPGGRSLEVFGVVKTIIAQHGSHAVGLEFQNLSVKDEQTLLFVCMQLLREQASLYGKI